MSTNICYVCNEQTDWRNDFSKIKTQHSKTAIVELLEKFLGDFQTKRDLKNESNRICIECITKIDEYDWTCELMLKREKVIRKILLRTENLYAERKLSDLNSSAIDSESEWADPVCDGIQEPKVEIEEIETNSRHSLNENVLIKDCDSDEDFDVPNDDEYDNDDNDDSANNDNNSDDMDYYPAAQQLKTGQSKEQRRSNMRMGQQMVAGPIEQSAEDETEKKSKRGRKKGQKNSGHRFLAKCSECEQEFKSSNSFLNHKRWHRKQREPKFKCRHCTFILPDQKTLDEHEELHKLSKKCECVICHKLFSQKGNLGLHMKIHQGIREHICDICGKDFLHITSFEAHMKYHNNERNIKCPHCTMSFVMSSHLNRHLQTHKKDKPYTCGICGNRFGYITNLRIHEKMHAGTDKNQICSICGANYARKAKLIQHMLKTHGSATPHVVIENGLHTNDNQPLQSHAERMTQ